MWQREWLARWLGSQELPELARLENGDRRTVVHIEQVAIPGNEDGGLAGDGGRQNPAIGRISNREIGRLFGPRNNRHRGEDGFNGLDAIGRELELGGQGAAQFGKNHFAEHEVVFREDSPEHISTEASGGEGSDEDVRIEADAHAAYETARKMSSSVR